MESIHLSIIIPVFNVEKYIKKNLKSIYDQDEAKTGNIEIIIINDGSQDSSGIIAKKFAKIYRNCTLIEQENRGLSEARNTGLKIAKGEYIWFIDGDDSIAPNSINEILKTTSALKPQILGINLIRINEKNEIISYEQSILKPNLKFNHIYTGIKLQRKVHIGAVPRFIFKRSFLTTHKLTFYPKILHEDINFMVKAFYYADKVVFINKFLYLYLIRTSGSIMSNIGIKSMKDALIIINDWKKLEKTDNKGIKGKNMINDNIFNLVHWIYYINKTNSNKFDAFIKENKSILIETAIKSFINSLTIPSLRKIWQLAFILIKK